MGSFENYLNKKKQAETYKTNIATLEVDEQKRSVLEQTAETMERQMYEDQQKRGLTDADAPDESLAYLEESTMLKLETSTFEERTEYYFKDSEYMQAKETRYRSLAKDKGGEMKAYAKKHGYRSATKRKKKATAAANSFAKASELEIALNEKEAAAAEGGQEMDHKELFEARFEIINARLEGMKNAARAKATSKDDEEYRIAKATLSCLHTMLDQVNYLRLEAVKHKDYFDAMQADLNSQIETEKAKVSKYRQAPTDRWIEAKGLNDQATLEKMVKDSGNPFATTEDAKMAGILSQICNEHATPEMREIEREINEKNSMGFALDTRSDELIAPMEVVRKDKYGKPLTKEDLRKEQWNKRWIKACKDPEGDFDRKALLIESIENFKKLDFPTPEQLKEKGLKYFIKKDPATIWGISKFGLRLDNIRPKFPIIDDYMKFDKEFKAKMDAAVSLSNMFRNVCESEFNLSQKGFNLKDGSSYEDMSPEEIAETRKDLKKEYEGDLASYEKYFEKIGPEVKNTEHKKNLAYMDYVLNTSMEKMQQDMKLNKIKEVDDVTIKLIKEFRHTNQQMTCPAYQAAYEAVHKKLGAKNDLSRICGSTLRVVHFNENWIPISKEDMANHEWNIKFLTNLNTYLIGPTLEPYEEREYEAEKKKKEIGKVINKEEVEGYKSRGEEVWYNEEDQKYRVKYSDEEYKKSKIVQRVEKAKPDSEKILIDMMREEYRRVFVENRIDLPDPELIKKEVKATFGPDGKPLDNIDCPTLEKLAMDKERFAEMSRKVLCYENPLKEAKDLPFGPELLKEFDKEMEAYRATFQSLEVIATMYMSKKYNFKIESGTGAAISALGREQWNLGAEFMELSFLAEYEKNYKAFKESA